MKTRVISGIVIVLMLLVTLVMGGYVTAGVLFFVSLIAYHELARALSFSNTDGTISVLELLGILAIVFLYGATVISGGNMMFYVLAVMLLFFGEAAVFVFTYPKHSANQLIFSVFSFIYAPMMLSFIYLLRIRENGNYFAWIPFVAWVCDTCAYFAGRAFGKHKLCPVLSPKKTIEGAIGGCLGSLVVGIIFGYVYATTANTAITLTESMISFGIITIVSSIFSQVGDLIASGIKRDHDIKDYGNLIPGHGGIMDRFDSVIFITPLIFFMATFLIK
ncbi:MAG: phosphatidate cytidylyltransferase [Butyrivibrio sp.]|nr:phosphatidate cytidylyltransferase [Butyrivibrio sp.]